MVPKGGGYILREYIPENVKSSLQIIFFHFHLRLAEESQSWMEQRHRAMWEKPPLMVHLTPREAVLSK